MFPFQAQKDKKAKTEVSFQNGCNGIDEGDVSLPEVSPSIRRNSDSISINSAKSDGSSRVETPHNAKAGSSNG